MTFPRRLLTEGEEVVVELRPHWAFLGWPLVATAAAVALAVGIDVAFPHAPAGVGDVLLGVFAVAALWLAGRTLRWVTTSLVLTTTRLVQRSGVLGRRALELRLERINELSYHQSLPGRVGPDGRADGGDGRGERRHHLRARPPAGGLPEPHHRADHGLPRSPPGPFRRPGRPSPGRARRSTARRHAAGWRAPAVPMVAPPPAPAGAAPSVADRLMQLGELRRRGIVSAAEFEAKKAELLQQL